MIKQIILIVSAFFFGISSSSGQTASDLVKKYGKPVTNFPVSENIWMTPEYAADGQVCRMSFHPKRVDGNTSYLGATLQFDELRDVLNSLFPPEVRGSKKKLNFGATATGGPAAWTTYPYERVMITFIASVGKSAESSPLRKGEFKFSVPANLPAEKEESSAPSKDDFSAFQTLNTEIVTVQWSDRVCSGK
jgi:hypothetical protein